MRNHRILTRGKLDPFPFRIRTKLGLAFCERRVTRRRTLDVGPRNLLPAVFIVVQRGDPGSEAAGKAIGNMAREAQVYVKMLSFEHTKQSTELTRQADERRQQAAASTA